MKTVTIYYQGNRKDAIEKMNELGEGYIVVKVVDWYHHTDFYVMKEEDYRATSDTGEYSEIIKRFE